MPRCGCTFPELLDFEERAAKSLRRSAALGDDPSVRGVVDDIFDSANHIGAREEFRKARSETHQHVGVERRMDDGEQTRSAETANVNGGLEINVHQFCRPANA